MENLIQAAAHALLSMTSSANQQSIQCNTKVDAIMNQALQRLLSQGFRLVWAVFIRSIIGLNALLDHWSINSGLVQEGCNNGESDDMGVRIQPPMYKPLKNTPQNNS